jgi:hypothetical protein
VCIAKAAGACHALQNARGHTYRLGVLYRILYASFCANGGHVVWIPEHAIDIPKCWQKS